MTMRPVYKATAAEAQPAHTMEPPRWPDRPAEFALSACPLGCDADWREPDPRERSASFGDAPRQFDGATRAPR
ncbi:hypothetical protein T281_04300 [Rhodomicrobium udaipurense JA643]|uniref:Uncharacterized protein n=1 Tax=Rhodomicrobium udaipurense TaxID=1202716 RepID=A0A8I1GGR0_9HYPH|nr:hypothetical protein [Rhodomicrobium udaipurense]KAI95661.1 hypothetical protein T281_04300 [Rhodomicrobium udaipurense JA643]MBJ7543065.1 hypothetical protein [Rhodomicrobium udaipurense]